MKKIHTSGKRKSAIARATVTQGTGKIRINNADLNVMTPEIAKMKIMEPLILADAHAGKLDIKVSVSGGGVISQADAVRLAVAKGILQFVKDKKLEKSFLEYDRQLLVADVRRKEVKKPNTHGKARAKTQKSYR